MNRRGNYSSREAGTRDSYTHNKKRLRNDEATQGGSSRSMLCNSLVNFDACVLVSLCKGGSSLL
jgi:hypothetical protein